MHPVTLAARPEKGRPHMWWIGLPGLDQPLTPPVRQLADRAASFACVSRITGFDVEAGPYGSPQAEKLAESFAGWLAHGTDADAHARRLAVCMTCEHVGPATTRSQVLPAAKWLHRYLTTVSKP